MQSLLRSFLALGLLFSGYVLGASGILGPAALRAQQQPAEVDDETLSSLGSAYNALNEAMVELQRRDRYRPAIQGINSFAISVGGLDVRNDLESGASVDPETFAGLYADRAIDDVAQHLDRDEEGRLTYKGNVIRMYPISRLKQLFAQRDTLARSQ